MNTPDGATARAHDTPARGEADFARRVEVVELAVDAFGVDGARRGRLGD
jgi:hypothetical protein